MDIQFIYPQHFEINRLIFDNDKLKYKYSNGTIGDLYTVIFNAKLNGAIGNYNNIELVNDQELVEYNYMIDKIYNKFYDNYKYETQYNIKYYNIVKINKNSIIFDLGTRKNNYTIKKIYDTPESKSSLGKIKYNENKNIWIEGSFILKINAGIFQKKNNEEYISYFSSNIVLGEIKYNLGKAESIIEKKLREIKI